MLMKITKRQLRRIIKEEKARLLREASLPEIRGFVAGELYDLIHQKIYEFGVQNLERDDLAAEAIAEELQKIVDEIREKAKTARTVGGYE